MKLSQTLSELLVEYAMLQPIERMAKHRFPKFSNSWWGSRIIGICLAWDALLMSLPLPIPLTNLLPAHTILFLSIGLLESDGLFILIGYGMTTATTVFFASIAGTIWQLANYWWHILLVALSS